MTAKEEASDIIRGVSEELVLVNKGIPIDMWFDIKKDMLLGLSLLCVEIAFKHCEESKNDFLIDVRKEIIKIML